MVSPVSVDPEGRSESQETPKDHHAEQKGVVVKPWNQDHHGFFNLKDYYIYKHYQDSDLVLDYRNSDLKFTK